MVKLTLEIAERGASHNIIRLPSETREQYLRKLTHLHLQNRNIDSIADLSAFKNLAVLYLYDNRLQDIENLDTLTNLTCLYLQRNNLQRITNLHNLKRLQRLYLGHNHISVVEGLEELSMLEVLHLESQQLVAGETLLFDPRSLQTLKGCLQTLNISNNEVMSVSDLHPLSQLRHLIATNNKMCDLAAFLHALAKWPKLQVLQLLGNPFCQHSKYREKIIVGSKELEELDGKAVVEVTRRFLQQLEINQKGRGSERDALKNSHSRHTSSSHLSRTTVGGECRSCPHLGARKPGPQQHKVPPTTCGPCHLPAWRRQEYNIVLVKASGLLDPAEGGPAHCIPRPFWRSKNRLDADAVKQELQSELHT